MATTTQFKQNPFTSFPDVDKLKPTQSDLVNFLKTYDFIIKPYTTALKSLEGKNVTVPSSFPSIPNDQQAQAQAEAQKAIKQRDTFLGDHEFEAQLNPKLTPAQGQASAAKSATMNKNKFVNYPDLVQAKFVQLFDDKSKSTESKATYPDKPSIVTEDNRQSLDVEPGELTPDRLLFDKELYTDFINNYDATLKAIWENKEGKEKILAYNKWVDTFNAQNPTALIKKNPLNIPPAENASAEVTRQYNETITKFKTDKLAALDSISNTRSVRLLRFTKIKDSAVIPASETSTTITAAGSKDTLKIELVNETYEIETLNEYLKCVLFNMINITAYVTELNNILDKLSLQEMSQTKGAQETPGPATKGGYGYDDNANANAANSAAVSDRYRYNGKLYKVREGPRGGKFIVVDGNKVAVRQ